MRRPIHILLAFLSWQATPALASLDAKAVVQLASEDSEEKIAAIQQLVQGGDPAALRVLQALGDDGLQLSGGKVVIVDGERVLDAVTGEQLKTGLEGAEGISINNRVRRELAAALAVLRLFDPDRAARLAAAQELTAGADLAMAPLLARALQREADGQIKQLLVLAHAQASLKSPDARVRMEAKTSIATIEHRMAIGEIVGRVFSGLSLGSIILLAALGLAITYGVMGVINMAHGELLMVGAYSTFAMQTLFARYLPRALDWYVVAAVPIAFLAAAVVGIIIERTVIRFLYGRPLETLLATWGLSLVLIQSARTLFGAQNVGVANPSWMSGGIQIMANAVLPWNRIAIIAFSLGVLALVWLLMNRTRLGMFVRAVTQNRAMAGCVGVPTGRIDTLAFAVGAGLAGLGGVALSQIANVGPDMGQSYIVDSFMVVVLGGVGQLAGAAWAALGLGVVGKFLEGFAGAVIAKIAVLAFIIVFIQKRPQGLFALKGRFVED